MSSDADVQIPYCTAQAIRRLLQEADQLRTELAEKEEAATGIIQEFCEAKGIDPRSVRYDPQRRLLSPRTDRPSAADSA